MLAKLFNWADDFSSPLIRQFVGKLGYPDFHIPGLGFLLTFVILWVVGAFTTNVVGKRVLQNAREALERLPVVRTIYTPVQTLMDTMTSPHKAGFKKVVMVEYPRRGTWALGFLASDVPREGEDGEAYSVFVPTAPNPTTGFILIVSGEEIRNTDLSVEAGFQLMLSGGVAVPPSLTMPADSRDGQPADRRSLLNYALRPQPGPVARCPPHDCPPPAPGHTFPHLPRAGEVRPLVRPRDPAAPVPPPSARERGLRTERSAG